MNQESNGENQKFDDIDTLKSVRKLTGLIYLLQILGLAFGGITVIIAFIINYLKKPEVQGTWLESHFNWQITTFWYTLALTMTGLLTFGFGIGYFFLIFSAIFLVYRVFCGWSRWNLNKAVE